MVKTGDPGRTGHLDRRLRQVCQRHPEQRQRDLERARTHISPQHRPPDLLQRVHHLPHLPRRARRARCLPELSRGPGALAGKPQHRAAIPLENDKGPCRQSGVKVRPMDHPRGGVPYNVRPRRLALSSTHVQSSSTPETSMCRESTSLPRGAVPFGVRPDSISPEGLLLEVRRLSLQVEVSCPLPSLAESTLFGIARVGTACFVGSAHETRSLPPPSAQTSGLTGHAPQRRLALQQQRGRRGRE